MVGHPVSIHLVSTIQSLRTGYFPVRFIWGVCAGISATRFGAFRSLRASGVSGGDFGALSPLPKIPFLVDNAQQPTSGSFAREPEGGAANDGACTNIADSTLALRTVGALPHLEVVIL